MSRVVLVEGERALALLRAARFPVVLVGTGARRAMRDVSALARRLGAPLVTTPEAKSQADEAARGSVGVFSFGASDAACSVVGAADLVLAIGTGLGEFASRGGRAFVGKVLIQVVDDARDVATGHAPELLAVQDVAVLARWLTRRLPRRGTPPQWFAELPAGSRAQEPHDAAAAGGMAPRAAVLAIGAALPGRCRIACDVTSGTLHVLRELRLGPSRRLWTSIEKSACMGSAIAAGVGLRLGSGLPTVIVIGDWGFMMGSSELHTVASLGIGKVAIVVWSNTGGALIRAGIEAQGIDAKSDTHTWSHPPRFELVARGYGLDATTARTAAELRAAVASALRAPGPVLIDAQIDPKARVPAGDRYLHLSAAEAV